MRTFPFFLVDLNKFSIVSLLLLFLVFLLLNYYNKFVRLPRPLPVCVFQRSSYFSATNQKCLFRVGVVLSPPAPLRTLRTCQRSFSFQLFFFFQIFSPSHFPLLTLFLYLSALIALTLLISYSSSLSLLSFSSPTLLLLFLVVLQNSIELFNKTKHGYDCRALCLAQIPEQIPGQSFYVGKVGGKH